MRHLGWNEENLMYESKNNNSHGTESNNLGPSIMMKLMRRKVNSENFSVFIEWFWGRMFNIDKQNKILKYEKTIESPMT